MELQGYLSLANHILLELIGNIMSKLQSLGKLLGAGEDYVEKMLAKRSPRAIPGQDISASFRPPKISDLGTHEMDVSNLKQLYQEYANQGASHADDRMKQLANIISRKEGQAERTAEAMAAAKQAPINAGPKSGFVEGATDDALGGIKALAAEKAKQALTASPAQAAEPNPMGLSPAMLARGKELEAEDKPLEEPAIDPIDFISPSGIASKATKLKALGKFIK